MAAKSNKLSKLINTKADVGCYPTKPDPMQERRYRAKDALSTLTRAEEIRRDKQLMRDVKTVAAEEIKRLQTVNKASGR